jgi:hypothetical protein
MLTKVLRLCFLLVGASVIFIKLSPKAAGGNQFILVKDESRRIPRLFSPCFPIAIILGLFRWAAHMACRGTNKLTGEPCLASTNFSGPGCSNCRPSEPLASYIRSLSRNNEMTGSADHPFRKELGAAMKRYCRCLYATASDRPYTVCTRTVYDLAQDGTSASSCVSVSVNVPGLRSSWRYL